MPQEKQEKHPENIYIVDIRKILKHLIEEFEQAKDYDSEIYYTKAIVSQEDDIRIFWHNHFIYEKLTTDITVWPNYTEYGFEKKLIEEQREEDQEGEFLLNVACGTLSGRNVIEGESILKNPIRKAIRLLLLRCYYREDIPDSDAFLTNFPYFAAQLETTKIPISYEEDEDIVLWYEFLLKLSLEHGSLIEGDKPREWQIYNVPYQPIVQELKTDVLKASILALEYLLDKAKFRSEQPKENLHPVQPNESEPQAEGGSVRDETTAGLSIEDWLRFYMVSKGLLATEWKGLKHLLSLNKLELEAYCEFWSKPTNFLYSLLDWENEFKKLLEKTEGDLSKLDKLLLKVYPLVKKLSLIFFCPEWGNIDFMYCAIHPKEKTDYMSLPNRIAAMFYEHLESFPESIGYKWHGILREHFNCDDSLITTEQEMQLMHEALKEAPLGTDREIMELIVKEIRDADLDLLEEIGLDKESPKLNDTEQNIIEALDTNTLTGERLSVEAGYPYNSNFKSTLSELRKRGILGNKSPGYFLEPKYYFLLDKSD